MEMEREGIREPYTFRESSYPYPVSRVGWGAAIAGFFIATVVQILLNALGVAIGLSAVGAGAQGQTSGTAIGVGAGIWTIVTAIISLFIGAWVAGRYTSITERGEGTLQGALVWSLSLIFFVWIAASGVTSALSGVMGLVGQGVQGGAQGAAQMGSQSIGRGGATGGGQQSGTDHESMIQNLMSTTGMSRDQAEKAVNQLSNPDQLKQQAAQAAQTTAKYGAAAAWWFFITALLSLGAAVWGGNVGFSRRGYPNRPART